MILPETMILPASPQDDTSTCERGVGGLRFRLRRRCATGTGWHRYGTAPSVRRAPAIRFGVGIWSSPSSTCAPLRMPGRRTGSTSGRPRREHQHHFHRPAADAADRRQRGDDRVVVQRRHPPQVGISPLALARPGRAAPGLVARSRRRRGWPRRRPATGVVMKRCWRSRFPTR